MERETRALLDNSLNQENDEDCETELSRFGVIKACTATVIIYLAHARS